MKFLPLLIAFLVGCVWLHEAHSVMPLPSQWARQLESHADVSCLSLNGEYEYFGEDADATKSARNGVDFVSVVFRAIPSHGQLKAAYFSFDVATRNFSVRIGGDVTHPLGRTEVRQNGACEDGWGILKGTISGQGTDTPPQTTHWLRRLKRGSDGGLYVYWTNETKWRCHFLLSECQRSSEGWARFMPVLPVPSDLNR